MFHSKDVNYTLNELNSSFKGLPDHEADARRKNFGPNVLISRPPKSLLIIFSQQFINPFIFILCAAAVIAYFIGDIKDTVFIVIVVLVNAVIGAAQEFGAEKSAQSLMHLSTSKSKVVRNGDLKEIDSENLVPGDIVVLESGDRVPADLRLIDTKNMDIDESLLTGESLTVTKQHDKLLDQDSSLGDRVNMAYSGSSVTRGRASGIVIGTGYDTELGKIADRLSDENSAKPPLIVRMEDFTKKISIVLALVTLGIALFLMNKGESWQEVFIICIAIAVAAIPEGLPISMTIALSIASRMMAKKNVIVRKLPAVEALGSCTYIATDKTGTLTVNQLTVSKVAIPGQILDVTGTGLSLEGEIKGDKDNDVLKTLIRAGVLANEGKLKPEAMGDAVDISLLILAQKAGVDPERLRSECNEIQVLPYESENQWSASLNKIGDKNIISVKGALEKILPISKGNHENILKDSDYLADHGFKVIALAGKTTNDPDSPIAEQMNDLELYGLIGLVDPLRPEAYDSIQKCQKAGIKVAMVTGDHPRTSLAIARELQLADSMEDVVSGPQLRQASDEEKVQLIQRSRVFARVDPHQKYEIVNALIKSGEFIAVTGDGANDAPALNAANVGIAMGKSGTDVAKETSDLIITDDRFASIVSGVEQGRIAYSNVRKVIYLLISTGMAELLLFILSLVFDTPIPLTAVQLLWLNLVTNGIQDKGLAFEPGEGDELQQQPRSPKQSIFDRLMIERVVLSSIVMGSVSFIFFLQILKEARPLEETRGLVLLLMVLFENYMIANCRSETKSAFALNPLRNKVLLLGVIGALGIHIFAMYFPLLQRTLGIAPVAMNDWLYIICLTSSIILVMEIYKFFRRKSLVFKNVKETKSQ